MTPTSVFQLARMRHLDLLATYYRVYPDHRGHYNTVDRAARLSKEQLVTAILRGTRA